MAYDPNNTKPSEAESRAAYKLDQRLKKIELAQNLHNKVKHVQSIQGNVATREGLSIVSALDKRLLALSNISKAGIKAIHEDLKIIEQGVAQTPDGKEKDFLNAHIKTVREAANRANGSFASRAAKSFGISRESVIRSFAGKSAPLLIGATNLLFGSARERQQEKLLRERKLLQSMTGARSYRSSLTPPPLPDMGNQISETVLNKQLLAIPTHKEKHDLLDALQHRLDPAVYAANKAKYVIPPTATRIRSSSNTGSGVRSSNSPNRASSQAEINNALEKMKSGNFTDQDVNTLRDGIAAGYGVSYSEVDTKQQADIDRQIKALTGRTPQTGQTTQSSGQQSSPPTPIPSSSQGFSSIVGSNSSTGSTLENDNNSPIRIQEEDHKILGRLEKLAEDQLKELKNISKLLSKEDDILDREDETKGLAADAAKRTTIDPLDPIKGAASNITKDVKKGGFFSMLKGFLPEILEGIISGSLISILPKFIPKMFTAIKGFFGKGLSGIKGLLGFGKEAEGVSAGAKVLGEIGESVGVLAKIGKITGKFLPMIGKLAKVGGKFSGILTIISMVWDFISGFMHAGDILGKSGKLDLRDKLSGGVGGVVKGFFDIVDMILHLFGVDSHLGDKVGKFIGNLVDGILHFLDFGIFKKLGDGLKAIGTFIGIKFHPFLGSDDSPTPPQQDNNQNNASKANGIDSSPKSESKLNWFQKAAGSVISTLGGIWRGNDYATNIGGMNTSAAGIEKIRHSEGANGPALKMYKDGNNSAIGYGHDLSDSEAKSYQNKTITKEDAEKLLKDDITKAEGKVRTAIHVPLSQDQFDALVSYAYNVGSIPSDIAEKINSGDMAGAAKLIREKGTTSKATGETLPGLVKRRDENARPFDVGSSSPAPIVNPTPSPVTTTTKSAVKAASVGGAKQPTTDVYGRDSNGNLPQAPPYQDPNTYDKSDVWKAEGDLRYRGRKTGPLVQGPTPLPTVLPASASGAQLNNASATNSNLKSPTSGGNTTAINAPTTNTTSNPVIIGGGISAKASEDTFQRLQLAMYYRT